MATLTVKSATPDIVVFEVTQGTDFRVPFQATDANDDPVDLTSYEAVRFRASYRDLTADGGRTTIERDTDDLLDDADMDEGFVHLALTPEETRALPLGRLTTWQLEVVDEFGEQIVIGNGYLTGLEGLDNVD